MGFMPVPIAERRRRLSWVEAGSEAELLEAAQELSDRASSVPKDLGDMAPDVTNLPQLVGRTRGLQATVVALTALLDAHIEMKEIALSDLNTVVNAASTEYDHRVSRRPELAQHYARLALYGSLRGQAIVEGRARARQTQQQIADAAAQASQAAAGQTSTPATTNTVTVTSLGTPQAVSNPSAPAATAKPTVKATSKRT